MNGLVIPGLRDCPWVRGVDGVLCSDGWLDWGEEGVACASPKDDEGVSIGWEGVDDPDDWLELDGVLLCDWPPPSRANLLRRIYKKRTTTF